MLAWLTPTSGLWHPAQRKQHPCQSPPPEQAANSPHLTMTSSDLLMGRASTERSLGSQAPVLRGTSGKSRVEREMGGGGGGKSKAFHEGKSGWPHVSGFLMRSFIIYPHTDQVPAECQADRETHSV